MNLLKQVVNESEAVYGAPTHSPQLVDLTLKEIVTAGKVTNSYQLFILGRIAGFFKNGLKSVDLELENPVNYGDESTSSAVKEALKSMSDSEHVQLAQYLLDCIVAGECMLHDEKSNVVDWMKFVLRKQD
jgi:hypothetical protein